MGQDLLRENLLRRNLVFVLVTSQLELSITLLELSLLLALHDCVNVLFLQLFVLFFFVLVFFIIEIIVVLRK